MRVFLRTRPPLAGRAGLLALLALCTIPATLEAREAPTDATVLIRVRGTVRVAVALFPGAAPEVTERRDVEIGTGSGFVVSTDGYIVTNHHVVSEGTFEVVRQGQRARVTVDVQSIEVLFPTDSTTGAGRPLRYSASLVGSDETLDLAVLYVSGSGLPVAALGDSDAVSSGEPVQALGYPLGDLLEVARSGREEAAPTVTSSPGAVSALRQDDRGELAYLQTTATLNPGNSGGPLVDQEGYVVGVVRMQVRGASGLGFAIPINSVKRFLATRGLDQQLPVKSLELGGVSASPGKGLSLRLPQGFQDQSQARLRVEAPFDGVALRIDRVASTWRSDQIEQVLLSGQLFESLSWTRKTAGGTQRSRGPVRTASARTADGDDELAMEFALAELPGERLMARYVGPADNIAFNRSTLLASLASLEGTPLIVPTADANVDVTWASAPNVAAPLLSLPIPMEWLVEPGGPSSCDGLPAVEAGMTSSPPHDFTIVLRAGRLSETLLDAAAAAVRCSPRRAAIGATSYVASTNWLGTSYVIEGVFLEQHQRLLHLQFVAPAAKAAAARGLLAAWVKQVSP